MYVFSLETLKQPACLIIVHIWATSWQNQQNECAPSEDSDQPGHPPSLIRVFAVRMKKLWVHSYPLSTQRRLWSDWADAQADLSLRWAHNHIVCFVMRRLIFIWHDIKDIVGVQYSFLLITCIKYIFEYRTIPIIRHLFCYNKTPYFLNRYLCQLENLFTLMILSFRTDTPGQTVQTQIRLPRVYTVCHSVCIVWTHYSMVEPHSSNLRVITTIFSCPNI